MLRRVTGPERPLGSRRPRMGRTELAVVIALAALAPGRAASQGDAYTLGPGHEDLVLAMTGGSERLPGGCALDGASIDRVLIRARYRCDDGTAPVLVLRHPSTSDAAVRTASFALEPSADAPSALVEAIAARVRARESELPWDVHDLPAGPRSSAPATAYVVGAVAAAILLAAVGALVWRRRRRRVAP